VRVSAQATRSVLDMATSRVLIVEGESGKNAVTLRVLGLGLDEVKSKVLEPVGMWDMIEVT